MAKFKVPVASDLVWPKEAREFFEGGGFDDPPIDIELYSAPKWSAKRTYEDRLLALVEVEVGIRPESGVFCWEEFETDSFDGLPKSVYWNWAVGVDIETPPYTWF